MILKPRSETFHVCFSKLFLGTTLIPLDRLPFFILFTHKGFSPIFGVFQSLSKNLQTMLQSSTFHSAPRSVPELVKSTSQCSRAVLFTVHQGVFQSLSRAPHSAPERYFSQCTKECSRACQEYLTVLQSGTFHSAPRSVPELVKSTSQCSRAVLFTVHQGVFQS